MSRAFPGLSPKDGSQAPHDSGLDLERRRQQLTSQLAELQWDLGGLVYEMATRDRIKIDVIAKQAAAMQDVDAQLSEIERIMLLEKTAVAGQCPNCKSPHSNAASYCWHCGTEILPQVDTGAIFSGV